MEPYEFSVDWFAQFEPVWKQIFAILLPAPQKMLEIGSYEGRSATFLMEHAAKPTSRVSLYCADTWLGGEEHDRAAMGDVEARFDRNIAQAKAAFPWVDVHKLKATSKAALLKLFGEGHQSSFDFIYIDGSHQAPDVLTDLVLAFELCRVGGLIACDDYLWQAGEKVNPLHTPKIAIDSFVNCYSDKVAPLFNVPIYQLWLRKLSE